VSEEMNQRQENSPKEIQASWEVQLQQRANELLAQRIGPFQAELTRLQASVAEMSARLVEQARPETTEEESAGLLDHVRAWFSDSSAKAEADFQSRLEQSRVEAAQAAREEAEQTFQARLEQARADWRHTAQDANEAEFQKRLETACAEAAGVARRESEAHIEELREQLEASRRALTLAVSSAQTSNFDALRAAIETIDAQRTQSDTLSALVSSAAQFAPRVVFFVVKAGDAVGWKARGFENGLNDDTARLLNVRSQTPSLVSESLVQFRTAVGASNSPGDNSVVLGLYGSPAPERAVAVPLVVRNKAAAVLYADSGTQSENSINTAALETLMRVAGMGIELLPSRRDSDVIRPTSLPPAATIGAVGAPAVVPALAPSPAPLVQNPEPAVPVAPTPDPFQTPFAAPEPAPVAAVAEAQSHSGGLQSAEAQGYLPTQIEAEPIGSQRTEEIPAVQITPPEPVAPAATEFAEMRPSAPTIPMPPEPEPQPEYQEYKPDERFVEAPAAPAYNPSFLGSNESFAQSIPFTAAPEAPRPQAPPMPAPASVPTPASETEQRAHNDARRFARLLVSEIKLYNAAKVNDGRRNFDLYDRLKDEIDRSRKVYDKRVSPAVAARFDYFYDELVQTLAEGDPVKLGDNCPGPVVLAS
jgi:hypothetical protein